MLQKYPKSRKSSNPFLTGFRVLLVAELVTLAGSYYVWRKLCNQQEFRYIIYQKYPVILNFFYSAFNRIEEVPGQMKRMDYEKWGITEK